MVIFQLAIHCHVSFRGIFGALPLLRPRKMQAFSMNVLLLIMMWISRGLTILYTASKLKLRIYIHHTAYILCIYYVYMVQRRPPPPPPVDGSWSPPPPLWLWGCGGALLVSDAADFLWFLVPPPPPVDVWMGHGGGGGGAGSMYINIYVYMNISICIWICTYMNM